MRQNSILILLLILQISSFEVYSQKLKTENIIWITFDGLRWQELFGGADSLLINNGEYTHSKDQMIETFWAESPEERRKMLFPFMWEKFASEGQLYGNRQYENKVNVTNNMWFSYPGYNEILSGYADDDRINSNSKIWNPNHTVLEFVNNQPQFKRKIAAFGSWDVFPYIINEERSGIPVNAGFEAAEGENLTERELFLNQLQFQTPGPWLGVRQDVWTHNYAVEHIKNHQPRLVYIAYGETDDWAHDGRYDAYLRSARQTDEFIQALYELTQSMDQYRDKTTFIISTDHGRGTEPIDTWRSHGTQINNADQIWIAVLGPDSKALGEVKTEGQLYQNQMAKTVATLLGLDYEGDKKVGKVIKTAIK